MTDDKDLKTVEGMDPEIQKLQQDLEDLQNARMQLMADFDNYRKRMDSEKAKFGALANIQLITQLLDILDDVQLAINDNTQNEESKHVLQIVNDKLMNSLSSVGVQKIAVNSGDKFDSTIMEAITTVPTEIKDQHNVVAQVISSAFRYAQEDTLLKSAKVIVYKQTQLIDKK
jgi:molecular chaperone GrpE